MCHITVLQWAFRLIQISSTDEKIWSWTNAYLGTPLRAKMDEFSEKLQTAFKHRQRPPFQRFFKNSYTLAGRGVPGIMWLTKSCAIPNKNLCFTHHHHHHHEKHHKYHRKHCIKAWWKWSFWEQGGPLPVGWDCKQMIIFPPAKGRRYAGAMHCIFPICKMYLSLNCKMYFNCGALCTWYYFNALQCSLLCVTLWVLHIVALCSVPYTFVTLCNECYTLQWVLHFVTHCNECYTLLHTALVWSLAFAWGVGSILGRAVILEWHPVDSRASSNPQISNVNSRKKSPETFAEIFCAKY